MKQRVLILITTLVVAAAVVPASFAGSPSKTQYPKAAVLVAKTKAKKPLAPHTVTKTPAVKSSGTLPFTGANLALVAGLGALALGGGLTLRTVGRRRNGE